LAKTTCIIIFPVRILQQNMLVFILKDLSQMMFHSFESTVKGKLRASKQTKNSSWQAPR